MKFKDLLDIMGDELQNVCIIIDDEFVGVFRAAYIPKEYDDCKVEAIMPDEFKGDSPFDGIVLKVWVTE